MEHLFTDEERKAASTELDTFRWFNFDHDFPNEYDVVSIEDYPVVRGWSQQDITRIRTEPIDNLDDLGLLQSWLFFGVLEALLGSRVPSEAFLRNTNGRGYVFDTTQVRILLESLKTCLLEDWRSDLALMNGFAARFERTMRFSVTWNRILINEAQARFPLDEFYDSIVRSSALLGESLYTLHEYLLEGAVEAFPDLIWHMTPETKKDLHARLVKRGWCRSSFPAADSFSLSVVYYAAVYPSGESTIDLKHENCTEKTCLINDIDVSTYKPKHAANCERAHCVNVTADLVQLDATLQDGNVPIVDVTQMLLSASGLSEDVVLPVISYRPGVVYVAFSHVWAHGRGSVAEEGLPMCQVKFLSKMMLTPNPSLNVYTPYLWMDSLCIPNEKEPRARAIQLMADIYSKASVTMVIDDGLQRLKPDVSPDYFLVRVLLSDWNRRLWTLQEATLSSSIQVATSAGLVFLQKQVIDSYKNPTRTAVSLRMSSWFIRFLIKDTRSILHIALLLSHRSSSKRSDEALALAPMLGIDPRPMIILSSDERMAALWKAIHKIPLNVLFMGNHERNSVPGYGWAPKTMMISEGIVDTTDAKTSATVTDKGLRATVLILRFRESVKLPESAYVLLKAVDTKNELCYLIQGGQKTTGDAIFADALLIQRELHQTDVALPAISLLRELDDDTKSQADDCPRYKYQALGCMLVVKSDDTRGSVLGLQVLQGTIECDGLSASEIIVS